MAWALVNTQQVELQVGSWVAGVAGEIYQVNTITAIVGTICNLIAYNGTDEYTPPEGYKLEQVPDTAQVGDTGY